MDLQELIRLRRHLHAYPELSGEEKETAKTIINFLNECNADEIITDLGGNGIIAVFEGEAPGKTVLIRCELDALPISEVNNFQYRSRIPGKGHMCGHDGHMAIVAGMAKKLSSEKIKKGKVLLLFQPAEENGEGAKAVIKESKFKDLEPDFVFALHNIPGYSKNEVILKRGTFTAAVNSMVIKLAGRTSHAGEPDHGINPAMAMSEIFLEIDKLNNRDQNSDDFRQISYIHASMGDKAYGTSAGEAELGFTFRCWTTKERDKLGNEMEQKAHDVAQQHDLNVEISYTESFHANKNADEAIDIVGDVAEDSGYKITWQKLPHRFGEDFGIFTEEYPGALFGLGAGQDTPSLHNPDYDFPDDIIETGIDLFHKIVLKVNS